MAIKTFHPMKKEELWANLIGRIKPDIKRWWQRKFQEIGEDWEDAFQTVLMRYERLRPGALWDSDEHAKNAISMGMHNELINLKRRPWLNREPIQEEKCPKNTESPPEELLAKERREELRNALHALPAIEKQIVVARMRGYSFREIAREQDIEEATARQYFCRAIRKMRDVLFHGMDKKRR